MLRKSILLSIVVLAGATTPTPGLGVRHASSSSRVAEQFAQRLREIDESIADGSARRAYGRADSLVRDMANQFVSGEGVGEYLGSALVLRAIAAHKRGWEREALWDWHVATQLFPALVEHPLSAYGETGPFLKSHPVPADEHPDTDLTKERSPASIEGLEPPKVKVQPKVHFPRGQHGLAPVVVDLAVIVGTDGRPRAPKILQADGALPQVCMALDSFRKWVFEPATLNGKPIEAFYTLTVNFRSRELAPRSKSQRVRPNPPPG